MRKSLLAFLFLLVGLQGFSQRKPMESSLLLGYQRYFIGVPLGFGNIGYTAFFENESLYRFTTRSRFSSNLLFNPKVSLYGLNVSASYSYVLAGGLNMTMIRQFPIVQSWRLMINPFVGLDFWFVSLHVGYNLQVELHPPLSPPPPPIARLNYTLNFYIPIKKNKRMYR